MFLLLFLALTLGACASNKPANAPAAAMPEAPLEERLVNAHLQALGGQENLQKIETVTMQAEVAVMGMNMPLKIYNKRPAMVRSEVNVTAMNMEIITAYDGSTAWTSNPMMGPEPQVLTGAPAQSIAEQAQIDGLLVGYKEKGYTLTYEGVEAVREKPAHKIKVERPNQSPVTVYLDAESHLIVKQVGQGLNPQSGAPMEVMTYIGDYRAIGGVMMPFSMEMDMGGQMTQNVVIKDIQVNNEIDAKLFALPVSAN